MSRSIFEHDSLQDIIHKHKHVFFVLFCFRDSDTNLLEGCRCDLAAISISDDYHPSINVHW